jgi:hypothetical protein
MALSKIDICNQALLKVGADTIASLDTSTSNTEAEIRSAKLCNIFFDQAIEEVVRIYGWNCAIKRNIPSLLSDTPTFEFKYAFQLPNDCIRVLNVYDTSEAYDDRVKYVIEGRTILCDQNKIYLKYTHVPTDISSLDPLTTQVLILKLAIMLAVPLQHELKMSQALINEYEKIVLPYARSVDTFENSDFHYPESETILSRYDDSPRF